MWLFRTVTKLLHFMMNSYEQRILWYHSIARNSLTRSSRSNLDWGNAEDRTEASSVSDFRTNGLSLFADSYLWAKYAHTYTLNFTYLGAHNCRRKVFRSCAKLVSCDSTETERLLHWLIDEIRFASMSKEFAKVSKHFSIVIRISETITKNSIHIDVE